MSSINIIVYDYMAALMLSSLFLVVFFIVFMVSVYYRSLQLIYITMYIYIYIPVERFLSA